LRGPRIACLSTSNGKEPNRDSKDKKLYQISHMRLLNHLRAKNTIVSALKNEVFFPAGPSIIILADQAIGVHHLPMKLNLVSKLIPALFIAAGLCIGCGGDHDHDHDHDHEHDHEHEHGKAEETSSGEDGYPLKTCIVEDENKLDSMGEPYVHVWKGTTVKFCCEGCLEDFEKEPEKYLAKLETANKGEAPANPEGESK